MTDEPVEPEVTPLAVATVPNVAADQPITSAWGNTVADDINALLPGLAAWTVFTPTLLSDGTPPNLGTGAVQYGRYKVSGGVADVLLHVAFGTGGPASPGSGSYSVGGLPVPFAAAVENFGVVGHGILKLANAGARQRNNVQALRNGSSPTTMQIYIPELWGSTFPIAPTFTDEVRLLCRYEI